MIFKFIIRRFLEAIPTLMVLITVTFFMMRFAPGSPFTSERSYPPEVLANIEAKYHLNEPLWKQYLIYLKDLAKFDFGPSFKYKDFTINQLISNGISASFRLGVIVFLISIPIGITLGMITGLFQNTGVDYGIMALVMIGTVIPTFVIAPVLILIFSVKLGWLPSGGWNNGAFKYMILPVIGLLIGSFAGIARLTRGSTIEVKNSNYVRTAKSKGLAPKTIVMRHMFKPLMLPIVTILGPSFVGSINGSLITETIYGIPGLGQLFINGANNRDYSLVMALTILVGLLYIIFNAVVDIAYTFLDPRIKY